MPLPESEKILMSDRLNIIFHDETTGDAYCLLALHDLAFEADEPPLQRLLNLLIERIDEQAALEAPTMAALAADTVRALASESVGAHLLPAAAAWLADITVRIRRIDGEFRLSCKTMDLSDLNLPDLGTDPVDAFDGFEGNAEQLQDLVEQIDWG